MLLKRALLKYYVRLAGKYLCQSHFLITLQVHNLKAQGKGFSVTFTQIFRKLSCERLLLWPLYPKYYINYKIFTCNVDSRSILSINLKIKSKPKDQKSNLNLLGKRYVSKKVDNTTKHSPSNQ